MEMPAEKAQTVLDSLQALRSSDAFRETASVEKLTQIDKAIVALEHWLENPTLPFPNIDRVDDSGSDV